MTLEIKTTEQLVFTHIKQYFPGDIRWHKEQWVSVESLLNWINKLRKSNDMWRYTVDDCFGMLEDALTSNSKSKNSKTNKD